MHDISNNKNILGSMKGENKDEIAKKVCWSKLWAYGHIINDDNNTEKSGNSKRCGKFYQKIESVLITIIVLYIEKTFHGKFKFYTKICRRTTWNYLYDKRCTLNDRISTLAKSTYVPQNICKKWMRPRYKLLGFFLSFLLFFVIIVNIYIILIHRYRADLREKKRMSKNLVSERFISRGFDEDQYCWIVIFEKKISFQTLLNISFCKQSLCK